ncbi:MAG: arylsulfatase [Verrucomicrobia bacterium]|nr:arylsulfatase [Verrucomicrobiota bacterium]MCF7709111.1 arylsulfatase [Verrucomicrobiota bacterium]
MSDINPIIRRCLNTMVVSLSCLLIAVPASHSNAESPPRPNIVIIMADDMGFSDVGCFGGEIRTPNIDSLASNGLRFTQFYNAARCCPTRASLLTGLYPHEAGMGHMVRGGKTDKPNPYQGYLNRECATIAEVLQTSGYRTYMSGKWHVGEFRPVWPVDRGFDAYYGLISGAMNYFDIRKAKRKGLHRHFAIDDKEITPHGDDFYTTDAFTDHAIRMLEENADKQSPFFLYLAYNAPHWPLHAWEDDIARYEGDYMNGWAQLRKERYAEQLEMGIINPKWKLSPQDPAAADWNSLDEEKRREMDRKMAVYAAQIDRMDWNIGRLIQRLKQMDCLDNTVIFFLSDNGACHESGALGRNFRKDLTGPIGTVNSYHSYGRSWSNASNTPFRLHKHWTHEGGISTPLIIHWPAGIRGKGVIRSQVGHIIDLAPTCYDLAGTIYPNKIKGHDIKPLRGISLVPFFNSKTTRPRTLFWEHSWNRAMRNGDWKLVVNGKHGDWELYNLADDRTELNNLADTMPEKVDALEKLGREWAASCGAHWIP